MATQKQREKKKKERERRVRRQILLQREQRLKDERWKKAEMAKERMEHELTHGKAEPIISDPLKKAEMDARKAKAVQNQLEKNIKILEALEAQMQFEHTARQEVHEKLESEGHKSLKEKMDALHQKALKMTGKAEELAKASEEYAAQQADIEKSEK